MCLIERHMYIFSSQVFITKIFHLKCLIMIMQNRWTWKKFDGGLIHKFVIWWRWYQLLWYVIMSCIHKTQWACTGQGSRAGTGDMQAASGPHACFPLSLLASGICIWFCNNTIHNSLLITRICQYYFKSILDLDCF